MSQQWPVDTDVAERLVAVYSPGTGHALALRKAREIHIVGIAEAGEFETKQSIVGGICFSVLQDVEVCC